MIKLESVSKFYKSAETVSVGMKRINLEFNLGEFVAVTGESGSGKSTLLNVISGLDGYEEGELYINGEETSHFTIADWERYRGSNIGFVFQNYNIIDSFTVYQNVLLALEVQGYPRKQRRQRALELIEKVGLLSHKNHKASKLSGGQKQRAVIARALAKDCPIIVADEPTGNLDSTSGAQVLKLLHDISQNKLVIVVTHDFEQVEDYATRKIKMHDGEVVEDKYLKKAEIIEKGVLPGHRGMSPFTLMRFTLRSLFAAPKRLIFLVLMQTIVMMAFTLVFTYRISQLREAENRQSSRFPNVTETRVLVERKDGSPFTTADLTYFENLNTVEMVYENGLAFYNSSPLYLFTMENHYGTEYWANDPVSGTDTAKMLKPRDVQGEMPTGKYEIVIGHDWISYEIGDVVKIGTSRWYSNPAEDDFIGTFTIVGIDKSKRNIVYFSDEFLSDEDVDRYTIDTMNRDYLIQLANSGFNVRWNLNNYWLQYNASITGRKIVLPGTDAPTGPQTVSISGWFYDQVTYQSEEITLNLNNVIIEYDDTLDWSAFLSEDLYVEIRDYLLSTYEYTYKIQNRPVVSLSVLGRNNGVKTVNMIDIEKYRAIYPANIPDQGAGALVFILGLFTGILLILMGLLLYSIVHAVSKNIMKSRKKDFAIFRSIGTNQSTLAKLVVLEQMMIALIASIIMLLALQFLGRNVPSIYRNIQYMEVADYAILMTIFLLFGAWLGLRFNKRIFKQTVIESIVTAKED
jgi:ABC-type lipoprotein export system ATPase subunit